MIDYTSEAPVPPIQRSERLSDEQRRTLFATMLKAREYDYAMQRLNRQGRAFGGVYSQIGNEAVSVGSASALGPKDILFPMHRNVGSHMVFGQTTRNLLLNQLAREGSQMRGTDGTGHNLDKERRIYGNISHLGSMIPVAAGFVLASKMRGEKVAVLTFIGDGGAQTGETHEGVNFASVQRLPFILIIENNQYAYSSPNTVEFACAKLSDRALGYGCYGVTIDGTDVELVYDTCYDAVQRGYAGEGPSMIETMTMRMRGHAEHDDFSYVPKEVLAYWQKRDPVERYQSFLIENKIVDLAWVESTRAEIVEHLRAEIDWVVEQPYPAAEEGYKNVFVE